MDLKQIGYYLYMQDKETKHKEQLKINEQLNCDLEREQATTKKEENRN